MFSFIWSRHHTPPVQFDPIFCPYGGALREARAALAREDYAAAIKTGVVLRKKRRIGGKDGYEVEEYEVYTALIDSLNSIEKRAAIEMGQEVDRQDINLRGKAGDHAEVLKKVFTFEELNAMRARMQAVIDAEHGKSAPPANIIDVKPILVAGDRHESTAADTASGE